MTNFIEKLKQVAAGRSTSVYFDKCPDTEYGDIVTKETVRCVAESCHETNGKFWATASNCFDELVAVAEAAEHLVGPHNLGKTIDTKIAFTGAISGVMQGSALTDLVKAIAALRQKVEGEGG